MLRGLAQAGVSVVMHGLVQSDELETKLKSITEETGVRTGHSSADLTNPAEIRSGMASSHRCHTLFWQALS